MILKIIGIVLLAAIVLFVLLAVIAACVLSSRISRDMGDE